MSPIAAGIEFPQTESGILEQICFSDSASDSDEDSEGERDEETLFGLPDDEEDE